MYIQFDYQGKTYSGKTIDCENIEEVIETWAKNIFSEDSKYIICDLEDDSYIVLSKEVIKSIIFRFIP